MNNLQLSYIFQWSWCAYFWGFPDFISIWCCPSGWGNVRRHICTCRNDSIMLIVKGDLGVNCYSRLNDHSVCNGYWLISIVAVCTKDYRFRWSSTVQWSIVRFALRGIITSFEYSSSFQWSKIDRFIRWKLVLPTNNVMKLTPRYFFSLHLCITNLKKKV